MNKVLLYILIFGIALTIIGLVQVASKSQVKLIGERIVEDAVKFNNTDITILSFNATKDSYRLRIDIEPLPTKFGGIEVKPLIFVMMVDDEGLREVLNNKTASKVYLLIEGLDREKIFTINDIGPKRFHMLFSTPLPEQNAKIIITMMYNKDTEPISPLDISLLVAGIGVIAGLFIIRRYSIL